VGRFPRLRPLLEQLLLDLHELSEPGLQLTRLAQRAVGQEGGALTVAARDLFQDRGARRRPPADEIHLEPADTRPLIAVVAH
jgi:hypothetical protein